MIRTHDEIKLTASSADLLISPRLGTYLPVEVYLDTAVNGDKIVHAGDDIYIIDIVYWRIAADRIAVNEVI